jgi:hypothetical protein
VIVASFLSRWKDRGTVEAVELDAANGRYPDLARVRAYWEAKRGDRVAPRRADIDPIDLKDVLPRVMLADVVARPAPLTETADRDPGAADEMLDFRYRLAGTAISSVHGDDATGKGPRDFTPAAYGALIHAHYCAAVRRRAPLLHLIVLDTCERSRSYARIILPLSERGSTVDMLMTVDSKEQNTEALRTFFAEATLAQ